MLNYFSIFLLPLVLTIILTPFWIKISQRSGFLDLPHKHKIHAQPMPTMGGIVIITAFLLCGWGHYFFNYRAELSFHYLIGITLASIIIVALGIYDDLKGCNAAKKLAVQLIAALVLYQFGFFIKEITNPFDNSFYLGFLRLPLTILWVLLIINAINLVDGVDGLATGVVLISGLSLFFIALNHQEYLAAIMALILVGAAAGFLPYNLPPARIFLGDTGSMFLGLIMAAVSLLENRKGTVTITLLLPIVALGFPILDTIYAFFRRVLRGRNPFRGDIEHLHHNLLQLGLNNRKTVLVIYLFCVYLGFSAYIVSLLPKQYAMLIVLVLAIAIFFWLATIKYLEKNLRGNIHNPAAHKEE